MRRKLTMLRSIVIATTVLLSATPLLLSMGQARAGQRGRGATPRTPEAPPEPNRTSESAPPRDAARGAGSVRAPEGGYFATPDSAPPGSVTPPLIPDMADRAFWTLYDRDRQITLSGKVQRVEWTSPNSYIFLQANGAEWAVEASFIHFRQASADPPLKPEQTITVSGYFPLDDPPEISPRRTGPSVTRYVREDHLIRAGEITTAFGQKLIMGRPPTEREIAEREKCRAFGC
jgi:hypothetical protein